MTDFSAGLSMTEFTFGSLFAGIGGIDLGLERAGMKCAWQVENDDYCIRVLAKHWPEIKRYGDVRECGETNLRSVDLIAGGFPCQPHSVAGKRRGTADDRNLWPEFRRVIAELRPRYILAENVPGIITTYLDTVLSDLESEGYACATLDLPAVAFDAPHRRERIFIVAYASGGQLWDQSGRRDGQSGSYSPELGDDGSKGSVADPQVNESRGLLVGEVSPNTGTGGNGREEASWWAVEPNVDRVAHGIPSRVDRLRGLGNAVVPQVAEWIGRHILEFDG